MKKKSILLFLIIVIVLIVKTYFYDIIRISGPSMSPYLKDGDFVIIEKYKKEYSRFDVVVLKKDSDIYVKRIIGLPMEEIYYQENSLFVNNLIVTEDFSHGMTADTTFFTGNYNRIPNHSYIVLGDNREDSIDSRGFGIVREEEIIGRIVFH